MKIKKQAKKKKKDRNTQNMSHNVNTPLATWLS